MKSIWLVLAVLLVNVDALLSQEPHHRASSVEGCKPKGIDVSFFVFAINVYSRISHESLEAWNISHDTGQLQRGVFDTVLDFYHEVDVCLLMSAQVKELVDISELNGIEYFLLKLSKVGISCFDCLLSLAILFNIKARGLQHFDIRHKLIFFICLFLILRVIK